MTSCPVKRFAVTFLGLLSIQHCYCRPGRWSGEPANLTSTQQMEMTARTQNNGLRIQIILTKWKNNLKKKKKHRCSLVRTTANIYT